MLERRFHATPMYPGSFMPEDGRPIRLDNPGLGHTLQAVGRAVGASDSTAGWFCLEMVDRWWQRWSADEGQVDWRPYADIAHPTVRWRVYVGQAFTLPELAAWVGEQEDPDRYRILLSNARGNGWEKVVRTRRGNFQPVEPADIVLTEDELATYLQGAPA